jgi:DNA repair ATPase RecN
VENNDYPDSFSAIHRDDLQAAVEDNYDSLQQEMDQPYSRIHEERGGKKIHNLENDALTYQQLLDLQEQLVTYIDSEHNGHDIAPEQLGDNKPHDSLLDKIGQQVKDLTSSFYSL